MPAHLQLQSIVVSLRQLQLGFHQALHTVLVSQVGQPLLRQLQPLLHRFLRPRCTQMRARQPPVLILSDSEELLHVCCDCISRTLEQRSLLLP